MFPTCILAIENEEQRLLADQLFIKYRRKMYAIAYKYLGNATDAEDAVSEAFVHIVDHIEKFEDATSKASIGLLSIITQRCAIRIFNIKKKIDITNEEENFEELEGDFNVENAVITGEQIAAMKMAIGEIGQIYEEIIILRYYYDFSYEDIGKLLAISPANARMRCSRALKLMKERIDG
jgi:RNA polymerase sigma-70 factor (ECF subfamily)